MLIYIRSFELPVVLLLAATTELENAASRVVNRFSLYSNVRSINESIFTATITSFVFCSHRGQDQIRTGVVQLARRAPNHSVT